MKNNIVVTIANSKRFQQAKSMFASVYLNANWKGSYMLIYTGLTNSQINWFKKRGIITIEEKPVTMRVGKRSGVHTLKFSIFKTYMKRWRKIIYLDTDIIVKSPLNYLTRITSLGAAYDIDDQPLYDQYSFKYKKNWLDFKNSTTVLNKKINLLKKSFNAGIIAFDSKIINKNTYSNLCNTLHLTKGFIKYADQSVMNLYFYNKWQVLPKVFNLQPLLFSTDYKIPIKNLRAIIFHFGGSNSGDKPWQRKNNFFNEWKYYYKKSQNINFKSYEKNPNITEWPKSKIFIYGCYLKFKTLVHSKADRHGLLNKLLSIILNDTKWSSKLV